MDQPKKDVEYIMHAPNHSDYLIHWTGRDIMKKHKDLLPNARQYPDDVVDDYISRLKNILKYGLWMMKHEGEDNINVNQKEFKKPSVARVCFTELKISDSLMHAQHFGPLGLGFKRLFVVNRCGSPVYYVPETAGCGLHPFFPPYSDRYNENDVDENIAFFKMMSSKTNPQGYIAYDLYEESEWRIIYSDQLREKFKKNHPSKNNYFINPRDSNNTESHQFYTGITGDKKPEFLVPVDQWLALIIYPNLQVKNKSFEDPEVRHLLKKLKSNESDHLTEGAPGLERRNFPSEVDIGAVAHF